MVSLALAVFMGRLDIYIVAIALPTVARTFGLGASAVAWVSLAYLLFNTGTMLFVGQIAERAGPRRLFLTGYAVFVAGSLLGALAPSFVLLVAARCVQGTGGSIMVIMTYSAVARLLPAERMGRTFGLLATAGALGVAVGSPLGGLLTAGLSWRWVFFVNVPVGIAAMAVAWRALPARAPGAAERAGGAARDATAEQGRAGLDYVGGALSFIALGALVLFLDQGQSRGWAHPASLVLLGFAAAAGLLFFRHESRTAHPLLAPALFRDRRVQLAAAASVAGVVLMGGNSLVMPFYLELEKGLGTAAAGALLLTYSVAFMAVSPFAGRLADRFEPRRISAAAMALGAAACVALALTSGAPGYLPVVAFLLALAVTYALFMSANSKQVMQAPAEEQRGAGPALLGTLNTLSLLLGASVFAAVFSSTGGDKGARAAEAGATGAWWIPGFSSAYLAGAIACGVALALSLAGRRRGRGASPSGAGSRPAGGTSSATARTCRR